MQSNKDDKISSEAMKMGKSPLVFALTGCKRDSGYGTDVNSPASQSSGTSVPRKFTFGSCDTDVDLNFNETSECMDTNDNEEVFTKYIEEPSDAAACQGAADDNDREVEELLNDSAELQHSVSEPIDIKRPQAPVPTPEGKDEYDGNWAPEDQAENSEVSRPFYNTSWTRRDRARRRFRPIASRSFGTQTPSPRNQDFIEPTYPLRPNARGIPRLRLRSESECTGMEPGFSPLPDVVPHTRDRSVSLPNVPSLRQVHEQEIGRELRRISDDFHSSFTPVRRREAIPEYPSSFPRQFNINIQACLRSIRRIVSSSSFDQVHDDPSTFDPTPFH